MKNNTEQTKSSIYLSGGAEEHRKVFDSVASSVYEIFNTMLGLDINADTDVDARFIAIDEDEDKGDICGIIGIAGELTGAISIFVSNELAKKIASTLLEEEFEEISEDVMASIGEMTNMIAGGIKTALSEDKDLFELAIPMVLKNTGKIIHNLNSDNNYSVLVVPFNVGENKLFVKIYLH